MTGTSGVMVLVALGLSMLAALLIVAGYNRLRRGAQPLPEKPSRVSAGTHRPAGVPGERMASAPAEMLQSIVRRDMASDPAFAGRSIDFGTAPDGSLEIWLDGQSYPGVDQIPDTRLRALIARSAEEFNRGGPAAS
jgi:hypothetical protein